jgi:phage shock protein A
MSLFKSIENLIRQKGDDLEKAVADPVANGRFAIEDSKKEADRFTEKIAELIAQTKGLEEQRDAAQAEVAKWGSIAEKAAAAGNEADVAQAVQSKQESEGRLNTLQQEVSSNNALISDLRAKLDKVRAQIASAESDLTELAAREEGAKVRAEMAKAADSLSTGGSPIAALGDLKKKVEADEHKAEALEEVSVDSATTAKQSLEAKYSEGNSSVDDEVARLMAAAKAKQNQGEAQK